MVKNFYLKEGKIIHQKLNQCEKHRFEQHAEKKTKNRQKENEFPPPNLQYARDTPPLDEPQRAVSLESPSIIDLNPYKCFNSRLRVYLSFISIRNINRTRTISDNSTIMATDGTPNSTAVLP